MAILSDASLEFAREHISKFYDSDFFPKPLEFEAIWHKWEDVKKELTSKNVSKIFVSPPKTLPAPKPGTGYRIVQQLEPVDALVYTALAAEVATEVENARAKEELHIACAYRLKLAGGSFFSGGTGWAEFNNKSEELSKKYTHVLVTDITDFYNQIYLHRLNNAIEHSNPRLKGLADEIEKFLSTLNSKSSQGVPVGPAASIVMSEAVLIDVDAFIGHQDFEHTRYVDDFRVFAKSERELDRLLESLTLYLYEHHRLTISADKTKIHPSEEFLKHHLHNHYVEQKTEIYETLQIFNPYTDDYEEVEVLVEDEEAAKVIKLTQAMDHILSLERLDLGLARSVIRAAKRHQLAGIAKQLMKNFSFFGPVVNDVMVYMHEVSNDDLIEEIKPELLALVGAPELDNALVRYWFEWYVSQHPALLEEKEIYNFIFASPYIESQARAAITCNNLAWVRDKKTAIFNLGG